MISLPVAPVSPRPVFNVGFYSGITINGALTGSGGGGSTNFSILMQDWFANSVHGISVSSVATNGEIRVSGTYRWQ